MNLIIKLKVAASILFSSYQLQAQNTWALRDTLLPNREEKFQNETEKLKAEQFLRPCFSLSTNTSYPSGYARIALNGDSIRIERSTFQDDFINSCMGSRAGEFKKSEFLEKTWTYIHIISECRSKKESSFFKADNVDCNITAVLNNFSENKELKEIIESHWKSKQEETNPNLYKTMKILNLLQVFNAK